MSASSDPDPERYGKIQVLQLPGSTPFRGPQQVQQSFNTFDQVARDLTLFNSQNSQAVFGNLLTLPIGEDGLLYVQPLYVEGTSDNSFPLLRKVLVNFGGQVGYADTLAEALDQVFGAGAGEVATDSGETPATTPEDDGEEPAPEEPAPTPEGGDGAAPSPDLEQAVTDLDAALDALADAQRSGSFAQQGQALEDLETAVEAYRAAQQAAGATATPGG